MGEIEILLEVIGALSNQLALTQYRLAKIEGKSDLQAEGQMRAVLITNTSLLKHVDMDDLTDRDLEEIEYTLAVLKRTFESSAKQQN